MTEMVTTFAFFEWENAVRASRYFHAAEIGARQRVYKLPQPASDGQTWCLEVQVPA